MIQTSDPICSNLTYWEEGHPNSTFGDNEGCAAALFSNGTTISNMLRERDCSDPLYYVCDLNTPDPTNSPTWEPTFNPTFDPTQFPSTKFEELHGNGVPAPFQILLIAGGLALTIIVLGVMSFYYFCRNLTHRQSIEDLSNIAPVVIRNALAVIICIAEYDETGSIPTNAAIGIKKDYENLKEFFQYLNYKVIPMWNEVTQTPFHWSSRRLIEFLRNGIGDALFNGFDNIQYDGLIVCISCHGVKDMILTSDMGKIEKVVLHRIVSNYYRREVLHIPRIFIIDACDGRSERASTLSIETIEALESEQANSIRCVSTRSLHDHSVPHSPSFRDSGRTQISVSVGYDDDDNVPTSLHQMYIGRSHTLQSMRDSNTSYQMWTSSNVNPDYNLAVLKASNAGFQAKVTGEFGSYLTYYFIKNVKKSVDAPDGKGRRLEGIWDDMQDQIHKLGRQLPEGIFFGKGIKNVVFRANQYKD